MDNQSLYQQYDSLSTLGRINKDIPLYLKDNLNQVFELRPYQIEAFSRFFDYYAQYPNKEYPLHILFNMATGSGKTLIMAGLILYLYEKGYRNFLFFVNSANIIEKTKDNFLNPLSSKYLFNQTISTGDKKIRVNKVENFEGIDQDSINIVFTTIQGLHADLSVEKENSLTFEDFKDKKIVLISDEAHHINVKTKNQQKYELFKKPNWENTVEEVLSKNKDNILLEFTATLDFPNKNIEGKYKNKIIYKYDLKQFRNDGYSKEVDILQADAGEKERILIALIINQYRQEVATKHGVNLKPVILFKAQKTIAESLENKKKFHKLINTLSEKDIKNLVKSISVPIVQKAFSFFENVHITYSILVQKLKINFAENKCISVNEEKEKEQYQLLINSLEDKNNQMRAVFAVQKLNEGWDVLNLFDIVRLYETRQSGWGKTSPTTIAEAQLIGRGARYYPFIIENGQDRYMRKYDKDLENELRILEELYYHSVYDSRYISELREALKSEGMLDDDTVERKLVLKDSFMKSILYKLGQIYLNEQIKNDFQSIKSLKDIGVSKRNYLHELRTKRGQRVIAFSDNGEDKNGRKIEQKDMKLTNIPFPILKKALAINSFFNFSNINHYFPHIETTAEFINHIDYLGGLEITFTGEKQQLDDISVEDMLFAVLGLLSRLEKELKTSTYEKIGTSTFMPYEIKKYFHNKILKINKNNERANGQEELVERKDWYVYNANYGTTQEKDFVTMLDRQINILKKKYKDIYLIRNENSFKIYSWEDGRPFEPDFVLYMKEKLNGQSLTYQIFIEPKAKFLQPEDKWKEDFLIQIKEQFRDKIFKLTESQKYRIIGVPFYNVEEENEFKKEFQEIFS